MPIVIACATATTDKKHQMTSACVIFVYFSWFGMTRHGVFWYP